VVGVIYSSLFPGGKVEHEKNHSDAVKREVMEELGAEIEITGLQDPIEHSYDCVKIRLFPYECKLTNNSPEPKANEMDHSGASFVISTFTDYRKYTCTYDSR